VQAAVEQVLEHGRILRRIVLGRKVFGRNSLRREGG
jgi:hypothetical protein